MIDPAKIPGFNITTLDRCDHIRSDPAALADWFADPAACRLKLDGLDPLLDGDALSREPIPADAALSDHILLGRVADGRPLFVPMHHEVTTGGQYSPRLWEVAPLLAPDELGLLGAVRSLVDWHARHGFCAVCGSPTSPVKAGWSRQCPSCKAEHFPRVDPVVIMLAEHEGRVLIGRQARFPPRRYSALAGFIEPGETIEAAVARELHEEAGIHVRDVRYILSQPWPFPSSLMIACMARADDDALRLDENEIEHAFWATADEVRAAMAEQESALFLPPPRVAIAWHLLRHWLGDND